MKNPARIINRTTMPFVRPNRRWQGFRLGFIGLVLAATPSIFANLQWETVEKRVAISDADDLANFEFKFRNEGEESVRISKVEVSCPCIETKALPQVVKPDEMGFLFISIRREGRIGDLENFADVTDSSGRLIRLRLFTSITPVIEFNPRIIWWEKGSFEKKRIECILNFSSETVLVAVHPGDGLMAEIQKSSDTEIEIFRISEMPDRRSAIEVEYLFRGQKKTKSLIALER